MNSQKILPANFGDALKLMNGMEIYVGCCEGRSYFRGKLTNIYEESITLLEYDNEHTIYLSNICFIILYDKDKNHLLPLESTNSELFERFHYFLNKKMEITKVNRSTWVVFGKLEFIEDDYLVMLEDSEKFVTYVHALGDFYIKTLRVFDE